MPPQISQGMLTPDIGVWCTQAQEPYTSTSSIVWSIYSVNPVPGVSDEQSVVLEALQQCASHSLARPVIACKMMS